MSVCVVGTDSISGAVSRGQLTLCDLAGSERVEKSGITSGERFNEATHINLSLSALAQVRLESAGTFIDLNLVGTISSATNFQILAAGITALHSESIYMTNFVFQWFRFRRTIW